MEHGFKSVQSSWVSFVWYERRFISASLVVKDTRHLTTNKAKSLPLNNNGWSPILTAREQHTSAKINFLGTTRVMRLTPVWKDGTLGRFGVAYKWQCGRAIKLICRSVSRPPPATDMCPSRACHPPHPTTHPADEHNISSVQDYEWKSASAGRHAGRIYHCEWAGLAVGSLAQPQSVSPFNVVMYEAGGGGDACFTARVQRRRRRYQQHAPPPCATSCTTSCTRSSAFAHRQRDAL